MSFLVILKSIDDWFDQRILVVLFTRRGSLLLLELTANPQPSKQQPAILKQFKDTPDSIVLDVLCVKKWNDLSWNGLISFDLTLNNDSNLRLSKKVIKNNDFF